MMGMSPLPKVLMVASEATPMAKTGGLADVAGALAAALGALGHEAAILMPRYRGVPLENARRVYDDLRVWFGPDCYTCTLYLAVERGVPYYLADCPALYDREGLYGDATGDFPDNHIRFAVLSRVALTAVRHVFRPHVIHCHDWQTALVPIYIHTRFAGDPTFMGLRTVLTLHNLGYQGLFPPEILPQIGLDDDLLRPDALEFHGRVNLLKGGIRFSDALTTVSPTYAREIQTPELGFGLDELLRGRGDALTGILNGADYSDWNPETDPFIAARYSAADLSGKAACKLDLLAEFGLPPEALHKPLLGIVSRFDSQKGFDLIEEIAPALAEEDCLLVVLGTGYAEHEQLLRELAAAHPEKIAVRVAYDNPLAHRIEAGADIFLMPSRYEPCGLNQIYSLRYGTVPVVRATGGLDDTIDESTGFKFREYAGPALFEAIRQALAAFRDRDRWEAMMLAGMRKDFSWNASAAAYSALYQRLAR